MSKRGLGWRKDPIDERDHAFVGASASVAPPPRLSMGAAYVQTDQGPTQACTAFASCQAIQIYCREHQINAPEPSPQANYKLSRSFLGIADEDVGSNLRSAFRACQSYGIIPASECPFEPANINHGPGLKAIISGWKERVARYRRIVESSTLARDVQAALAQGFPIAAGFPVYESFEEQYGPDHIEAPEDGKDGALAGWHALCVIGYDTDEANLLWFEVGNSWGPWRQGGRAWISEKYLLRGQDFWAVEMVAPPIKVAA